MRLVDADDLKKKLDKICNVECRMLSDCSECNFPLATGYLNEQPTVEAEPVRHGKWIDSFIDAPFISIQMVCVCSSCKDIILRDNKERYLYCPHCGCKMDLEKNSVEEVRQ